MSKPDDPTQIANAPLTEPIEQTKDHVPLGTPESNDKKEGRTLGQNETKPDTKTEFKTAMVEETQKPLTWAERMEGTKRAYNENNEESKGKNLYKSEAAAATVTTEKTQPPKVEPKAGGFVKQLQETPKPPPQPKPTGPKR